MNDDDLGVFSNFTLSIEGGNEEMRLLPHIVSALRAAAHRIEQGHTHGPIRDLNGNKVGWFQADLETEETEEQ